MTLPAGVVKSINAGLRFPLGDMAIHIGRASIVSILDNVRNRVLDWAIKMEQEGIIGEGITFSNQEREQAQNAMTHISIGSIGNFAGNLGEGNRSTSISATQATNEAEVFSKLAAALEGAVPDADERMRILKLVASMEQQRDAPGAFAATYGEFITAAANHMQIVAPFLPALLPFLGA